MKTAKEMFEELGYERYSRHDYKKYIRYTKDGHIINFSINEQYYYVLNDGGNHAHNLIVTIEEFKAITQQMKELGWIE